LLGASSAILKGRVSMTDGIAADVPRYDRSVTPPAARSAARGPGRPRDTEATRNAILDAAELLFSRRSFEGVSTQELVDAAGVTKGALYHHFADKEAVYAAVAHRAFAAKAEMPADLMAVGAGPEEELIAIVTWFVRSFFEDEVFRGLVNREMLDPRGGVPQLLDPEVFVAARDRVRELLAVLAPGADSDTAMASLLALIYGLSSLRGIAAIYPGVSDTLATSEEIARHATNLVLHGLSR